MGIDAQLSALKSTKVRSFPTLWGHVGGLGIGPESGAKDVPQLGSGRSGVDV